jgi:excisionase family DNA binding protein
VFVTPKEAAAFSGLSEMRVRKLIASGELPSMLDGRSRRVFAVYDRMIAKTKASNPPARLKLKANPFFGVRPQEKRGVTRCHHRSSDGRHCLLVRDLIVRALGDRGDINGDLVSVSNMSATNKSYWRPFRNVVPTSKY